MRYIILITLLLLFSLLVGVVAGDTMIAYTSNETDGYWEYSFAASKSFPDMRAITTATTLSNTSSSGGFARLIASSATNNYTAIRRGFYNFPTDVGVPVTVSCATVSIWGSGTKTNTLNEKMIAVLTSSHTDPIPAEDDFGNFDDYILAPNVSYDTWGSNYNNYTFYNASDVNTDGYTTTMLRNQWDVNNNATGLWVNGGQESLSAYTYEYGTRDPFIKFNFTETADETPPHGITNLDNTTNATTIAWRWANPADSDYNHTMVWKNGVFFHNVSNSTPYDLWTGLDNQTDYTISTKTVDLTGNVNATFNNKTSRTTSIYETTYSFIHLSDLQSMVRVHPELMNNTFQDIETQKSYYNISAIFISGDLSDYSSVAEYTNFTTAVGFTSVPYYIVTGNHDGNISNWTSFFGSGRFNYSVLFNDFIMYGFKYVDGEHYSASTYSDMQSVFAGNSTKLPLLLSHKWLNVTYERFGLANETLNRTFRNLLVLSGHEHPTPDLTGTIVSECYNGSAILEDIIDPQDLSTQMFGRLYKVYKTNDTITAFSANDIYFVPDDAIDNLRTYDLFSNTTCGGAGPIYNQTISGFTTEQQAIVGDTILFNVTLPNDNATIWNWSFGDGIWQNGTSQNASHVYSNGGIYTIKEIAQNPSYSNITTLSGYLTIYNRTITGFTANVTTGVVPLAVGFNVTKGNDNATIWNWSFGDGVWQNGTTQNATHVYSSAGTFTVIEISSNNALLSNTTTIANYINLGTYNQTRTGFSANVTSGVVPLAVGFNVTLPTDNATRWNWSFGDGTWSNGTVQNVSHSYSVSGIYSVTEIAYNPSFTNSTTRSNYITVGNQTRSGFNANVTAGLYPLNIQFNVTLPNDNATVWNWSFGDGIWQNGTTQNATHIYTTAGLYTVVEISSNSFSSNTTTRSGYIGVYNQTIANFTKNATIIIVPPSKTVYFNSSNSTNASWWNWSIAGNWYNTSTISTRNTTYSFTTGGNYTVNLTTSNNGYGLSTINGFVTVYNSTSVDFTGSNTSGLSPVIVNFTDSSTNATSWYWNFGDGNTSTDRNPTHIYTIVGSFSVNHSASNPYNISWNNKTNYITVVPLAPLPIVNFTATPLSGPRPLTVTFTDNTTGGLETAWNYSFGDGSYSALQNPTHIYAADGHYTVMLAVANGTQANTTTKSNYITVITASAFADFSAAPLSGNYPLTVQFTDLSACDPVCNAWSWDFDGDGSIDSIGQNPQFVYNYPLTYSPKLIVTNGFQTDTKIKLAYITVGPVYIPTTIPQPTGTPVIGYRDPDTGGSMSFRIDNSVDVKNSTYLKGWLQNFTETGDFNVYAFGISIMAPIMHVFGYWIFSIIWGLFLFAVWTRTQDIVLPLILGIISSGLFFLVFPTEILPAITIMFVMCGAIIVTKLMKDQV